MLHNVNQLNTSMQSSKVTLQSLAGGPLPFRAHMKLANNLGNSLISDQLAFTGDSSTLLNQSLLDLDMPS